MYRAWATYILHTSVSAGMHGIDSSGRARREAQRQRDVKHDDVMIK
jgi:hypothetical protein